MLLTEQILEEGKSSKGAWNKKQLLALGVEVDKEFRLKKGWKTQIIGSQISEQQIKRFLDLRNAHLDTTGNLY